MIYRIVKKFGVWTQSRCAQRTQREDEEGEDVMPAKKGCVCREGGGKRKPPPRRWLLRSTHLIVPAPGPGARKFPLTLYYLLQVAD